MGDTHPAVFAAFFEARRGSSKTQWLLLPPSVKDLGSECPDGYGRFLRRALVPAKPKAAWTTLTKPLAEELNQKLKQELVQYESTDWNILDPVVIALELDDYALGWRSGNASTPQKALRHIEAQTKKRGYRLTFEG